jgi:hypothetical protein
MGIRAITADVFVHPHHDPGVLNEAHEFLSPFVAQYSYVSNVMTSVTQMCQDIGYL